VPVRPILRTNNANVIATTLIDGHAAGPVQELLVSEELAAGKLIHILPDYEIRPTEAFLAYPSVRFMRPVVRAFTDFVVPALRAVTGICSSDSLSKNEILVSTTSQPSLHDCEKLVGADA
jgi:DNA-binding transcriptional LysR family regulator